MILHKQSDTDRAIIFYMISSTDKTTGITGSSPTVTLSKNGGTFAACTGTVAEISGGVYKLTPSAADVGTLGITVLRATGTGADTYEREIQIIAITPYIAPGAHGGLIVLGANDMEGNSLEFNCNVNFVGGLTADTITAARYIAANVDTTPGYLAMTATNANAALPSAIWNALTSGLTTAGSAGKLLVDNLNVASSTLATATNLAAAKTVIDATNTLVTTNLDAKVSEAGGGGGTGARTVTVTVNDGATALQNAIVRMTEGANSYTATTNASGVATFNLDDATYTVSISKSGYSYAGTTLVVDGTETPTYSMTAVTITAPSAPTLTTAYLTTYTAQGTIEGSVVIRFKMEDGPGTAGYAYNSKVFTATSNATTGLLEVELIKSTQYSAKRGNNGEWVDFTTGTTSTYALPEVLGTP